MTSDAPSANHLHLVPDRYNHASTSSLNVLRAVAASNSPSLISEAYDSSDICNLLCGYRWLNRFKQCLAMLLHNAPLSADIARSLSRPELWKTNRHADSVTADTMRRRSHDTFDLHGVRSPQAKGQFWGENERPTLTQTDSPLWALLKWVRRSRCHLGCGLKWAQGSTH